MSAIQHRSRSIIVALLVILGGFFVLDSMIYVISFSFGFDIPTTFGVVGDAIGMLVVLLSLAAALSTRFKFEEIQVPLGLESFAVLFPEIENDSPVPFREPRPHLVDFREGFIVRVTSSIEQLYQEFNLDDELSDKTKKRKRVKHAKQLGIATIIGHSGSGKTMSAIRFAYELNQSGWTVFYTDITSINHSGRDQTTVDGISRMNNSILLIIDNIHADVRALDDLTSAFENRASTNSLKPLLRILCISREITKEDEVTTKKREGRVYSRYPLIPIKATEEIAGDLLDRVVESSSVSPIGSAEDLLEKAGYDLAVFAEMLRCLMDPKSIAVCEIDNLSSFAIDSRLRVLSEVSRRIGMLILGVISAFSSIDSSVSRKFVIQSIKSHSDENVEYVLEELLNSNLLLSTTDIKSRELLLTFSHPSLGHLIFNGCQDQLDFLKMDEFEIRRSIHLAYLVSEPPNIVAFLIQLLLGKDGTSIDILWKYIQNLSDAAIIDSSFFLVSLALARENLALAEEICKSVLLMAKDVIWCWSYLVIVKTAQLQLLEAEKILREGIIHNPEDSRLLGTLADLLVQLERRDEAISIYRDALEISPNSASLWCDYGSALGLAEEAMRALETSLKLDPNQAETWSHLGALAFGLRNDLVRAESALRKALSIDSNIPHIWISFISILREGGKLEEAREEAKKALEIHPEEAELWHTYGRILQILKRYADSEGLFERALHLDPEFTASRLRLAQSLFHQEKYVTAKKCVSQYTENEPDDKEGWRLSGIVLVQLDEFDASITCIKKALSLDPEDAELWDLLGFALKLVQNAVDAESAFRRSVELDPRLLDAWFHLGDLLAELQRIEEAEEIYRQITGTSPDSAKAWHELGNFLYHYRDDALDVLDILEHALSLDENNTRSWSAYLHLLGISDGIDGKKLLKQARRSIEIFPDNPDLQFQLCLILFVLGLTSEGRATAQQLMLNPKADAYTLLFLGDALKEIKEFEIAESLYRRTIQIEPLNFEAYQRLGQMLIELGWDDEGIQLQAEGERLRLASEKDESEHP